MSAMGERIAPGSYFQYPPPGVHASPLRSFPSDRERYLGELLGERHKLGPFVQILPNSIRLINQEIRRASLNENADAESPLRLSSQNPYSQPMDFEGNSEAMRMQYPPTGWPVVTHAVPTIRRIIRLDIPIDKYPTYNFVGRILGPRGNSLKRVEAVTGCRVYIRGRGSVKDAVKEEKLKDRAGYEHLEEPLHVLVEGDFPENIANERLEHAVTILESLLKPVDESLDQYKKNQLRELAMLNGTLREASPSMSPTLSPFNTTAMKRPKTGR